MSSTNPRLRQRLLQDIEELCSKPYPNITLHVHDDDLTRLCLVISPPAWQPMHLSVQCPPTYPLTAPVIRMDSSVVHPNVFGSYICATILNTDDGYTPAYTLKAIAIQMLSFFGSDFIEQDHGGAAVNIDEYRSFARAHESSRGMFTCKACQFGQQVQPPVGRREVPGAVYVSPSKSRSRRRRRNASLTSGSSQSNAIPSCDRGTHCYISSSPNEIILQILEQLTEFEDLINLARAWPRVSQIITQFDVIRQREMQCFTLKKSYHDVNLGVGVSSGSDLASEFDFLSREAFAELNVRYSIHHIRFDWWLPLPISRNHWHRVRQDAHESIQKLKSSSCIKYQQPTDAQVLYQFMTDIVVKLNNVKINRRDHYASTGTLKHASDKAIESYFHLFHLLVCLATEDGSIVQHANRLLTNFERGKRSKTDVPNLGHLLVALLISDVNITPELMKAIVTEAVTRNVVWLLKDHPELAYKEPDAVSAHRLDTSFRASRTSYRLLMFSELFRRTARPNNIPLTEVREQLFNRHGGPPPGAASHVAAEVRRLHSVNDFTQFMREMGFPAVPSAVSFTSFLRRTLDESVEKGYSRWTINQAHALALRLSWEPSVGIPPELQSTVAQWSSTGELLLPRVNMNRVSFFPQSSRNGAKSGKHNGHSGGRRRR
ncbi:hypothetical protein JX266_003656 [Neoarthrinium moseri]|nr:hypothetical protein JX266_003656 [Neoarthrinium moseri]